MTARPAPKPDRRSPEADTYRRWYKSARWRELRQRQLAEHPLCQCPHCREGKGRWTEANTVDHIIPHRGDKRLFWDAANLQSLSKECHSRWKQSQETGGHGFLAGCDEHGEPLAQDHEWHEPARTGRE